MGDFIPPTNGTGHDDHAAQPADAFSSSLAQAALASMDAPNSDALLNNNADQSPPSGKKSRSKACDECRKSKVSCQSTLLMIDTNGCSADVCTMSMGTLIRRRLQNQLSREVRQAPNDLHDPAMASGALRMLGSTAIRQTEAETLAP
jgi:hypothetical protein